MFEKKMYMFNVVYVVFEISWPQSFSIAWQEVKYRCLEHRGEV